MKVRSLWTICLLFAALQAAHAQEMTIVTFGNPAPSCAPSGVTITGLGTCPTGTSFVAPGYSWSMSSSSAVAAGTSVSANPAFTDQKFTKAMNDASAPLLLAMLKGSVIPQMRITVYGPVVQASGIVRLPIYEVLLEGVYVTGLSSTASEEIPQETLTVGFEKIKVTSLVYSTKSPTPTDYLFSYDRIANQFN
jgi:type VI protein secretion system component Hcp